MTENSAGIGTVSREMVQARAAELAVINGRSAHETSQSDWEQAQLELTGDSDTDPNEEVLDSAAESERWDPVHGSTGHKVPAAPGEDEDDEGRSDNERLVDEGMAGAEHDQRRQATEKPQERRSESLGLRRADSQITTETKPTAAIEPRPVATSSRRVPGTETKL